MMDAICYILSLVGLVAIGVVIVENFRDWRAARRVKRLAELQDMIDSRVYRVIQDSRANLARDLDNSVLPSDEPFSKRHLATILRKGAVTLW